MLYLWDMKGQLLTCTDTSCGPQPDVLCVTFTQWHEWDPKNVIITGCADGIIRVRFLCMLVDNMIVPLSTSDYAFKVTIWQLFAGLIDQWERFLCFYTVFQCSSHYFGISLAGRNLNVHQGFNNSMWVVCDCIKAYTAPLQSKLWTLNSASLRSGHPYNMHTHTHTNGIIALLLPWVMGCACELVHMWVCLLLCWITSDFATRYVSLIQIWKMEYTRTQLPGPPEEPVSPGQDQTERDGNVTCSRMGYGCRFCSYGVDDSSEAETLMRRHKKKIPVSERTTSLSN